MKRRDFLQFAGALTAQSLLASALVDSLFISTAHGQEVALKNLRTSLNPQSALILIPGDTKFKSYQSSYNKLKNLTPQVRVMCSTPEDVSVCLQWAQANGVPLAIRCGGHSYEGFSQSRGIIIDTRPMNSILFSASQEIISVGAGCNLGSIYTELGKKNLAIPAGSCPAVGVSGHTTGGGYGLLSRSFGLACDNLTELEMVLADGRFIIANENTNADIFWACRGGGGGSFGIITKLHFSTHKIAKLFVYGTGWQLDPKRAAKLIQTWQLWASNAPSEINTLINVSKKADGSIVIRGIGQSIGSEDQLRKELKNLFDLEKPDRLNIKPMTFTESFNHFDDHSYPIHMKAKSDYVKGTPMSREALAFFLANMPHPGFAFMFDSYGGAINKIADDATAFAHRSNSICSIQYYSEWEDAALTDYRLKVMRKFYESMEPYRSGSAYVNYCDLDLQDFAQAYWGKNLERLSMIKSQVDSNNLLQHAQSVPLKIIK